MIKVYKWYNSDGDYMKNKKLIIYLAIISIITVSLVAFVGIPLINNSIDDSKDVILEKTVTTDNLYMDIRVHSDGKVDKMKVSTNFKSRKNYHFVKSLSEDELNRLNELIDNMKKHKLKKADEMINNVDVKIFDNNLISFYNYESGYRSALLNFIESYIDSDNAEK